MEKTYLSVAILVGLALFGVVFDQVVARLGKIPGGHEGFTALLVVIGVAVTLSALWPLIGTEAYFTLVAGFVCSGVPMIAGNVARYVRNRAAGLREIHDLENDL